MTLLSGVGILGTTAGGDWNEGWTADWTDGHWTEDWTWTGQESPQEYASNSQRPENSEI